MKLINIHPIFFIFKVFYFPGPEKSSLSSLIAVKGSFSIAGNKSRYIYLYNTVIIANKQTLKELIF